MPQALQEEPAAPPQPEPPRPEPPRPGAPVQAAAPAAEELPELPSWLAGTAGEVEEIEWTPPPVKPLAPVDLNKASLSELERLPGVGFIMAQSILAHRDANGPFDKVEDLLMVQGMSQGTLKLIYEAVFIEAQEELPPAPVMVKKPGTGPLIQPMAGDSATLMEARQTLSQGLTEEALTVYDTLIRGNQSIEEVISDLQEVSYHYPNSLTVWQHLGDAYLRANKAKEALEAYIKAEKLLR